jgi:hypothetical protein
MLDKMIEFIRSDLRHCIGVDANWVVALALSSYTETFGHFLLPDPPKGRRIENWKCYNEFLSKWMHYGHLIDPSRPKELYDHVRNGLAHEYVPKTSGVINMGTGPCGIEVIAGKKGKFIRFNIITYYNDFMESVKEYRRKIQTNRELQKAFDQRMKGRTRLH